MNDADPVFHISTYRCCAGPDDPIFEERHELPTIALVRDGRFTYHGEHGTRLLETGSLLLGNARQNYACSHEDSHGDCCLVVHYDPATFEEIAASAAGSAQFRFSNSALPGAGALLPWLACPDRWGGLAPLGMLQQVLANLSGAYPAPCQPNASESRAIRAAVDLMESDREEPVTLAMLAMAAGMSKFHFVRSFTKVIGASPYRYLLNRRLTRAAEELLESRTGVAAIAFDNGFGDLSTFNLHFRRAFGSSPTEWRRGLKRG